MPDVFGGAEKQCGRVSKGIQDAGEEVKILTSRQKLEGKAKEIVNDVEVERLYSPIAPDLLGRWLPFSLYWLLRVLIWGVIHNKEFDVIHCHQGKFGAFVGCCLARLFNKPILIKVGNSNQYMDFLALKSKKIIGPLMAKFVLNTNPTVVAISEVIAKNCADFGFKNIINIPNSIDHTLLDNTESLQSIDSLDKSRISLFYHGRLEDIKKIDVLLASFNLLTKQFDNVDFHLIGSGSVLNQAKQYIASQGLDKRVFCYGEVKNPVIFIQQFDIFVNASEAEGFSNSLLEALLVGKVLISTPVSGASDAIKENQNGFLSTDFSAESICEAVVKGISLFEKNEGQVEDFSRELINDNFLVSIIAQQYSLLYKKLLSS
jgi:glycosyltransferase involved in cell wall biosynthesis